LTGSISKSPAASSRALLVLTVLACAALVAAGVTSGSARAATANKKLTIVSIATRAQYLNNADDRRRAIINNPFTTNTAKLMAVMKGTEKRTGPLPGDTALFSFSLYNGANVTKQLGSEVFLCQYNFNNNALCTAYFELTDGVLLATGKVNFNTFITSKFTLSVRGGTKAYLGARGVVTVNPAKNAPNTRRLDFVLLG
jgi:hypothetical protein